MIRRIVIFSLCSITLFLMSCGGSSGSPLASDGACLSGDCTPTTVLEGALELGANFSGQSSDVGPDLSQSSFRLEARLFPSFQENLNASGTTSRLSDLVRSNMVVFPDMESAILLSKNSDPLSSCDEGSSSELVLERIPNGSILDSTQELLSTLTVRSVNGQGTGGWFNNCSLYHFNEMSLTSISSDRNKTVYFAANGKLQVKPDGEALLRDFSDISIANGASVLAVGDSVYVPVKLTSTDTHNGELKKFSLITEAAVTPNWTANVTGNVLYTPILVDNELLVTSIDVLNDDLYVTLFDNVQSCELTDLGCESVTITPNSTISVDLSDNIELQRYFGVDNEAYAFSSFRPVQVFLVSESTDSIKLGVTLPKSRETTLLENQHVSESGTKVVFLDIPRNADPHTSTIFNLDFNEHIYAVEGSSFYSIKKKYIYGSVLGLQDMPYKLQKRNSSGAVMARFNFGINDLYSTVPTINTSLATGGSCEASLSEVNVLSAVLDASGNTYALTIEEFVNEDNNQCKGQRLKLYQFDRNFILVSRLESNVDDPHIKQFLGAFQTFDSFTTNTQPVILNGQILFPYKYGVIKTGISTVPSSD